WKLGLTWQTPVDGLRFRALQSRDIRAPNLDELFKAQQVTVTTVTNLFTGVQQGIQSVTRGNSALKPEKSQTTEVGAVFKPSWMPGFSTSFDYSRIALKGQISNFSPTQSMELCFAGSAVACTAFITNPPNGDLRQVSTQITQAISTVFNLASTVTDGFDVE